jgi:hypothetical protein
VEVAEELDTTQQLAAEEPLALVGICQQPVDTERIAFIATLAELVGLGPAAPLVLMVAAARVTLMAMEAVVLAKVAQVILVARTELGILVVNKLDPGHPVLAPVVV